MVQCSQFGSHVLGLAKRSALNLGVSGLSGGAAKQAVSEE